MKHLAAYLLLGLGGNTSPSAADIKTVLESVGIEADSERLDKLLSELEGKDINEVRPRAPLLYVRDVRLTRRSSSPLDLRSSPPSRRAAPVALPRPVVLPLAALPPPRRPPPPSRRRRRSPTRTWVSVCSTKRIAKHLGRTKHEGASLGSTYENHAGRPWVFGRCRAGRRWYCRNMFRLLAGACG
jgi:hypothetical protein